MNILDLILNFFRPSRRRRTRRTTLLLR